MIQVRQSGMSGWMGVFFLTSGIALGFFTRWLVDEVNKKKSVA